MIRKDFDLQLFRTYGDGSADTHDFNLNVQTTLLNDTVTPNDLSPEMKTFYSDYLIDLAEGKLVHDQFGQKHPIPSNGGKTIEFRKYDALPKSLGTLQEGVTPDGQKLNVTAKTATVDQYGDYVTLSDMLILSAIDNNIVQATKLIGSQAGRTLDTVTREVINAGTNVRYAGGNSSRAAIDGSDVITVEDILKAVRDLKAQNAEPISGSYVAIVHPDVAYDLMRDDEWIQASLYAGSTQLFNGEIGRIGGVRFVETTEAKIFKAEPLAGSSQLLVNGGGNPVASGATSIPFDGGTVAEHALKGRKILIDGVVYTVSDNTASAITISAATTANIRDNKEIYPGEAGAAGIDVYSTLVLADNAYGVTDITGGGLQHIVKQLGDGGTADPLNQRATIGWKATKVAEILVDEYMVRIESSASYGTGRSN